MSRLLLAVAIILGATYIVLGASYLVWEVPANRPPTALAVLSFVLSTASVGVRARAKQPR